MRKKMVALGIILLFVATGCTSWFNKSQSKTNTHKFMEHAGVDWFNF